MSQTTITLANGTAFIINGIEPLSPPEAAEVGEAYGLLNGLAAQANTNSAVVPGRVQSYAVAGVPDATLAANLGQLIWVTNGNAGAACPAISDGVHWKVIALGSNISAT